MKEENKWHHSLLHSKPVESFLQKAQTEWQSTYEGISDSLKKTSNFEEKTDNRVITLKKTINNH